MLIVFINVVAAAARAAATADAGGVSGVWCILPFSVFVWGPPSL